MQANLLSKTDYAQSPFGKDFKSPKEFIEIISRKYVYQQENDKNDGMFDTKVFEELFGNNMKSLLALKSKLESNISSLNKECQTLEKEYKTKLGDIGRRSDRIFKEFKTIESTINKISTKTVRIGGTLESVESQRNRAIEAKRYCNYIANLNDENAKISKVFGENSDYENAVLIKNLLILAQELDMPYTECAKKNIEKAAEEIEQTQLERFIRSFQEKKYNIMRECARTLFELNGGDTCVRSYINQLGVLIDNSDDIEFLSIKTTPNKPNVQASTESENEATLTNLKMKKIVKFNKKIYESCMSEFEVIMKVFPSPALVIQRLVTRVFEQRIHTFIQHLMSGCSKDTFLKLLSFSFQETNLLLDKIIEDCPAQLPKILFKKLLESVFSRYRDVYIKKETSSLFDFLSNEVWGHNNPYRPKASVSLSPEITIRCLERAGDAVDRCYLLSPTKYLAKNMCDIFFSFIGGFGREMRVSLEEATRRLTYNANMVELSEFFSVVQSINPSIVLLRKFYYDKISPHLEAEKNYQTICMKKNNDLLHQCEELVVDGLEKLLVVQITHVGKILSKEQKKSDFRPSPAQNNSLHASKACLAVCEFLKIQLNLITCTLDGKNVELYLIQFGTRILDVILNHIKKFTIEKVMGGLCLMRDALEYQERIATFKIPHLSEEFEILKAIAKLHLVNPDQLKDVVDDTKLSKLSKSELISYIKQRSDYDKSWNDKYL